jgi:hypothetical protein
MAKEVVLRDGKESFGLKVFHYLTNGMEVEKVLEGEIILQCELKISTNGISIRWILQWITILNLIFESSSSTGALVEKDLSSYLIVEVIVVGEPSLP